MRWSPCRCSEKPSSITAKQCLERGAAAEAAAALRWMESGDWNVRANVGRSPERSEEAGVTCEEAGVTCEVALALALVKQQGQLQVETALEFCFDLRHEVVDHVLQHQLRGRAQFAVEPAELQCRRMQIEL